jgi:hypothetical protein
VESAAQSMCKEKMCAGDALQTEPVQNERAATYFAKSTNSFGDGNHFDWAVFVALFLKLGREETQKLVFQGQGHNVCVVI